MTMFTVLLHHSNFDMFHGMNGDQPIDPKKARLQLPPVRSKPSGSPPLRGQVAPQASLPQTVTAEVVSAEPKGSTIGDLFRMGLGGWSKVLLCTVLTPFLSAFLMLRRHDGRQALLGILPRTMGGLITLIVLLAMVGFVSGIFLSMWSVVAKRRAVGKPVSWFFVLLFGKGILSALIWILSVPVVVIFLLFVEVIMKYG